MNHTISSSAGFSVTPVPALEDNFMYLLVDTQTNTAAAIDPVEPAKILSVAKKLNCNVTHVLTTHAHWDHDGGNEEFVKLMKDVVVIGGIGDGVKAVTKEVRDKERIMIGRTEVEVLETPFHTKGHVCYYVESKDKKESCVFTGDCMFIAGCGNLNTGTKEQLYQAFVKLGNLKPKTRVYCGHEYTVANLQFAQAAYQNKKDESETLKSVNEKLNWANNQRSKGLNTIPSTIEEELKTSPFLRAALGMSNFTEGNSADNILWVRQYKSSGNWKL